MVYAQTEDEVRKTGKSPSWIAKMWEVPGVKAAIDMIFGKVR